MHRLSTGKSQRFYSVQKPPTPPSRALKEVNPIQYKILRDDYQTQKNEYLNNVVQEELDNAESLLTMSGNQLIKAAKAAGLDTTKSARDLQTELFTSAVSNATAKLPPQNHGYTNAEIVRLKERFLEQFHALPFIGLTASKIGVSERLIQAWIRTDGEFATMIYEAQKRMAESVAGGLYRAAIQDGDVAAMMFLAKQFGSVFNQVIMQNITGVDEMQDTEGVPSIENLTPDEQLMFLNLIRKAKNPQATSALVDYTPTKFIEEDPELDSDLADEEDADYNDV